MPKLQQQVFLVVNTNNRPFHPFVSLSFGLVNLSLFCGAQEEKNLLQVPFVYPCVCVSSPVHS